MLVRQGTKVLGVSKSEFYVSLAIHVSAIGMCVVTGVYILPVRAGFTPRIYVDIWDTIVESVHALLLQFNIATYGSLIVGDFNAHSREHSAGDFAF